MEGGCSRKVKEQAVRVSRPVESGEEREEKLDQLDSATRPSQTRTGLFFSPLEKVSKFIRFLPRPGRALDVQRVVGLPGNELGKAATRERRLEASRKDEEIGGKRGGIAFFAAIGQA